MTGPSQEQVQEALEHLELVNVATTGLIGQRSNEAVVGDQMTVNVDMSYATGPGHLAMKFEWHLRVLAVVDDDETQTARETSDEQTAEPSRIEEPREALVAQIDVTFEVEWRVDDETYEVEPDVAEAITSTTGLFAAYPYARESLQSLSSRLQLSPIVLGKLMRGTLKPASLSVVDVSSSEHSASLWQPE